MVYPSFLGNNIGVVQELFLREGVILTKRSDGTFR